MPYTVDTATITTWTSLMRAGPRALVHIEAALAQQALPPLGWYDALWEIEQAGQAGLRPFELQKQLLLPQYGMSRLLGRIEKAGYISKSACRLDRRGYGVTITPEGKEIRARMWPVYSKCLVQVWQEPFSAAELQTLKQLLDRIAR